MESDCRVQSRKELDEQSGPLFEKVHHYTHQRKVSFL